MKYPFIIGSLVIVAIVVYVLIPKESSVHNVVLETAQEKKIREQGDMDVINQLKKAGSDLEKPHKLEHHFNVKDKKTVEAMSTELKQMGYEVNDVILAEVAPGKNMLTFDAIKSCTLEPNIIFAESENMEMFARKYGVQYDGWGCMVVK